MKELEKNIKQEIIDLHDIFVHWFTGYSNKTELEHKLSSRFFKDSIFIPPNGVTVNYNNLMMLFKNGYGQRSMDFKILISDVELLQEIGDYVLVNYVEWQTDDAYPEVTNNYNVRKTTLIISKEKPFKWLHTHETMLPMPSKIIENWKS